MSGRVGHFLVIEGIDGAGTTTQTARLVSALAALGHTSEGTCEPSSGPIGTLIRQALERRLPGSPGEQAGFDWSTFALLFAADRLDHVARVVRPAISAGRVVVSDRYTLSSLVYQSVTAPDGANRVPWIAALNAEALVPTLTIVLDVPVELAAERRHARGGPEELFDALSLQRRLAAAYADARSLIPEQPLVHVSGDGTPEAVHERVLAAALDAIARRES